MMGKMPDGMSVNQIQTQTLVPNSLHDQSLSYDIWAKGVSVPFITYMIIVILLSSYNIRYHECEIG